LRTQNKETKYKEQEYHQLVTLAWYASSSFIQHIVWNEK